MRRIVIFILICLVICSSCARKRPHKDRVVHVTREEVESLKHANQPNTEKNTISIQSDPVEELSSSYEMSRLSDNKDEQILSRVGYTLSYNQQTKLAYWVGWHLTSEHTDGPYSRKGVPYYDEEGQAIGIGPVTAETLKGVYFLDITVKGKRQEFEDWASAKDYNMNHGHLCPAADNKWSKEAMNQSFLLTNMCPQDMKLNGGDWEKLEKKCRSWAKRYGDVFIVAGPVFYNGIRRTMGENKVGVPDAFYKVVLCLQGEPKAIGFIYPNTDVHHEMKEYVKSVDEVEKITGINFFHNLQDDIENKIESESNLNIWR